MSLTISQQDALVEVYETAYKAKTNRAGIAQTHPSLYTDEQHRAAIDRANSVITPSNYIEKAIEFGTLDAERRKSLRNFGELFNSFER